MASSLPPLNSQGLIRNLALGLAPTCTHTTPEQTGGTGRAGDEADIDSSLAQIKSLLAELDERTAALANSTEPAAEAQSRIDQIVASIDQIVNRPSDAARSASIFDVSNVSPLIQKYAVRDVDLKPGESLDVHVVVTQSAQQGALFLSLGGALDLSAADAQFSFEVGGRFGSRLLVFASGTTLANMVETVNHFTKDTGVEASISATGIRLQSTEFGDDKFVSVNMVDNGGLNEAVAAAGVYQYSKYDLQIVSAGTGDLFSQILKPVEDFGQDAAAVINGIEAEADGFRLHVREPHLNISLALQTNNEFGPPNSHQLGKFIAFTITAQEQSPGDALAQQIRKGLGV